MGMSIIRPVTIADSMFQSSNIAETEYAEFLMGTTYADGDIKQITIGPEILTLDVAPATAWVAGELITGQTSAHTARVISKITDYTYYIVERTDAFHLGEVIGVTGTPAKLADQGAAHPTTTAPTANVHMVYESLVAGNVGNYPPTDVLAAVPKWLALGPTNRWKVFDLKIQSQSSQATSMNWVFNPGLIDSISYLNLDATSLTTILADQNLDLITNGNDWTAATGTTPPTSWDLVGHPSNFLIDSGALKITADAANEGISQTVVVVPETEMQLLGIYKNTAGDIAQYSIRDMTNGVDVLATTDLTSSTVSSTLSHVFTVPVGCISLKISLMAKANGDIVWFDTVSLAPVVYNDSITLLSTVAVIDWYTYFFEPIVRPTDLVRTDVAQAGLPPISAASVTVTINNTGGSAKCGGIVTGLKFPLGRLLRSPSIGIIDYSTKTVDSFGNYSISTKAYSKRLSCSLWLNNSVVDETVRQLATYRATPMVYIGSEDYSSLIIYGFYKSFEIEIAYPNHSECSLDIEGLT